MRVGAGAAVDQPVWSVRQGRADEAAGLLLGDAAEEPAPGGGVELQQHVPGSGVEATVGTGQRGIHRGVAGAIGVGVLGGLATVDVRDQDVAQWALVQGHGDDQVPAGAVPQTHHPPTFGHRRPDPVVGKARRRRRRGGERTTRQRHGQPEGPGTAYCDPARDCRTRRADVHSAFLLPEPAAGLRPSRAPGPGIASPSAAEVGHPSRQDQTFSLW